MKKKILYVLILLMIVIWGINAYFYSQSKKPNVVYIPSPNATSTTTTTLQQNVTISRIYNCSSSSDCSWQSTNCCPETAGANWECINVNESVIKCIGNILCPQVISPKPTTSCNCQQGECAG